MQQAHFPVFQRYAVHRGHQCQLIKPKPASQHIGKAPRKIANGHLGAHRRSFLLWAPARTSGIQNRLDPGAGDGGLAPGVVGFCGFAAPIWIWRDKHRELVAIALHLAEGPDGALLVGYLVAWLQPHGRLEGAAVEASDRLAVFVLRAIAGCMSAADRARIQ